MGNPVPQITTSGAPDSLASWNMRMRAGRTCELCKSKLSFGPYRFVGIAEMKLQPYWRRYDWHNLMPAILATAYASFVGSRGAVSRYSSLMGCGQSRG